VLSHQDYTPWGEARGGDITQTTLDFTGQRKDDTGLLYYGARYYDPVLGRFLSPDSIVPGLASGKSGMAATLGQRTDIALRPLAVDFHESGFVAGLAREDAFTEAKGFWFQLSNREKQRGEGSLWQWGPRNPQTLNRYGFVLNNPLRYTDPSGHSGFDDGADEGAGSENLSPGTGAVGGDGEGEGGGGGGGGSGYSGGDDDTSPPRTSGSTVPDVEISFQTRHIDDQPDHLGGLSYDEVTGAILDNLRSYAAPEALENFRATGQRDFWGYVQVDGVTFEYRAYILDADHISVGTFFTVRGPGKLVP